MSRGHGCIITFEPTGLKPCEARSAIEYDKPEETEKAEYYKSCVKKALCGAVSRNVKSNHRGTAEDGDGITGIVLRADMVARYHELSSVSERVWRRVDKAK